MCYVVNPLVTLVVNPGIISFHFLWSSGSFFTSVEYSLQNMVSTPKLVNIASFETAKNVVGNKQWIYSKYVGQH